jgi:hypothetical protein
MSMPIKFSKTDDELLLADILESWSIEDVAKLVKEMEADTLTFQRRRVVLRSRRAIALHQALQRKCGSRRATRNN